MRVRAEDVTRAGPAAQSSAGLDPASGLTALDEADFEARVVTLLPDLCSAAIRLTRDRDEAEDLVAEAVAQGWRRRDSLRDAASFRGWLFRILTNLFLAARRARAAGPGLQPLPDDEERFSLFERLHQPFLLWWGNPEREFLNRLLKEDIARAIDALPAEFRVVVVLIDVEGFGYQEAADALDIPIGTVRSRLARARARLQKSLWTHAVEAGLANPDPDAERSPDA